MEQRPSIPKTTVIQAQAGDTEAIERLCRDLVPIVRRAASTYRSLVDRDDIVQDTMVRVLQKLSQVRNPERVIPWVLRVMHSAAISALRSMPRTATLDEQQPAPHMDTGDDAERINDIVERTMLSIGRLPVRLRETARLAYAMGTSQSDIADRLRIPLGTVKSRLAASRDHIQTEVQFMSREQLQQNALSIRVTYGADAPPKISPRGYGMFFGSVLEVGDTEEVLFYDYPGPVLTMVTLSEVRRLVHIGGCELYEVYIKHLQSEPEHPTFLDYFSAEPDSFHWHMRATLRGEDPVVHFNDGTSAWQPMPRTVSGDDDPDMHVRTCTVEINGTVFPDCASWFDASDREAPAERIYDRTGRQIAHRRYATRGFAEKRKLPWERLPEYAGPVELGEPHGLWYDCVLRQTLGESDKR